MKIQAWAICDKDGRPSPTLIFSQFSDAAHFLKNVWLCGDCSIKPVTIEVDEAREKVLG